MKVSEFIIFIILVLAIAGGSFYMGKNSKDVEVTYVTEVTEVIEEVIDTVFVKEYIEIIPDSLHRLISLQADSIQVLNNNNIATFNTSFRDSILTAWHTLEVNTLTSDVLRVELDYILRNITVREYNINTEKVVTRTIRELPIRTTIREFYFQGGLMTNLDNVFPAISINTRNHMTLMYGYDFFDNRHSVGVFVRF